MRSMRWIVDVLSSRYLRLREQGERGAAAALVAVVCAGGVALGMLALTMDVGAIYNERRELQNGSDAAAQRLAAACAHDINDCSPSLQKAALVQSMNDNAKDGLGDLDYRPYALLGSCGRGAGAKMQICRSATTDAAVSELTECLPLPTWMRSGTGALIPYVETYGRTKSDSATPTILPGKFSRAVAGQEGTTVRTCSRVAWGPAVLPKAQVLALTTSECDWLVSTKYVGPGTAQYPRLPEGPKPGYNNTTNPWPSDAEEQIVYSKGDTSVTCDTSSPGGTAPGGFGWVEADTPHGCFTTVVSGTSMKGNTGNDGCTAEQLKPYLGTVVHLPIYDCVTSYPVTTVTPGMNCKGGKGNSTYYHISGFAPFYLSGWFLTKGTQPSIKPPYRTLCSKGKRCLYGWFVTDLVSSGKIQPPSSSGTPAYGLITTEQVG